MSKKLTITISFILLIIIIIIIIISNTSNTKIISMEEDVFVSVDNSLEDVNYEPINDLIENPFKDIDYDQPTFDLVDEYKEYISYADTLCPFVTTASTGMCLDNEVNKQTQRYNFLEKEILIKANIDSEQAKAQNTEVDLATSDILKGLPEYTKIKDDYIMSTCSIKNYSITGTAIVGESLKCIMYYNYKDIQMLESVVSSI